MHIALGWISSCIVISLKFNCRASCCGSVLRLCSTSSACVLQSLKDAWWLTLKDLVSVDRRVATAAVLSCLNLQVLPRILSCLRLKGVLSDHVKSGLSSSRRNSCSSNQHCSFCI